MDPTVRPGFRHVPTALWTILALSGLFLAARTLFGPFRFGVSVNSPINAESFFALTSVVLLMLHSDRSGALAPSGEPGWKTAVPVILGAGIAAWAWTVRFPWVADDYAHIANSLGADGTYLTRLFTVPAEDRFFRPFVFVAYAAQARVFGTSREAWHAFSIALHLANSLLLYGVALRSGLRHWPALAAALLFLLHGSRPEAVTWIAAQFDLWAALFSFLALLAFDRFTRTAQGVWQTASLAALLLALLSKESAYVFPLVALLWLYLQGVRGWAFARRLAPAFVLTATVFAYRWILVGGLGGYLPAAADQPSPFAISLTRTPRALTTRLAATLAFPVNWSHPPAWWLAALMLAAMAALAVLAAARSRRTQLLYGLGLLLLTALPVHQFLFIDASLEKSRVLYLPTAGFALLMAAGWAALRSRAGLWAAAATIVFQTAALEHNLGIWREISALAENTCAAVARAAAASPSLTVSDVPNFIDGVYFLHTGLRPCVEAAAGAPLPHVRFAYERKRSEADGPWNLRWNDERRGFEPGP